MLLATSRDAQMMKVAAAQHAVISAAQLRGLGANRDWVRRRVAAGMMKPLFERAYVVGPLAVSPTPDSWRMAALLSCTKPAAISHQDAAERWGAWRRGDGVIHVVSTVARANVADPVIQFHRVRNVPETDIVVLRGMPTTTMVRSILDLGLQLSAFQIAHIIYEAVFLRLLDIAELESRLLERWADPGTAVVRHAIAMYRSGSAGTRSRTEDRFLDQWLRHGFSTPIVNNPASVGIAGLEPDFVWPERRLIVEIDGESGHGRPGAAMRDGARDIVLGQRGWRVLRYPAQRVWTDLDGVVASVRSQW